jgi:Skp family chaperone for outer membrane proteins
MAQVEIGASVNIEFQSVGNLRQQLRQANEELIRMQQEFGAASDEAIAAAQRVAEMRDQIDEARQAAELFDPGAQFKAFVDIGSKIASGFAAVQGAMSLVGVESEDVEKALLKVQSAMALAQGLSDLKDFGEAWGNLRIFIASATQGMSGFKKALISSGIGALVVAVGTLVAYWDDIKGLVNGVSKEQEKLTEQTEKNLTAEQDKMDALKSSEEILKLQGKSEREILKLKIEQIKPVIVESKARIKNAEDNKILQIAAAKRNNEFTKMAVRGWIEGATAILRALAAPIDLILVTANNVSEVLGFGKITATTINEEITKMNVAASDWVANQLFDPEKVRIESEESIKTMKKTLLQQENEYAGYQNQLNGANNKGNKDRSEANEKAANEDNKRREEADQVLAERRKSLMTKRDQELLDIDKKYNEDLIKLTGRSEEEINILKESYRRQRSEVEDQYRKEQKEKEKEFVNEINKIIEETRLAGIKDQREKEKAELQITHQEQLSQIAANENLNFQQRLALTVALLQKQRQEKVALQQKFDQEDLQKESAKLLEQSNAEDLNFAERLAKIKEREDLESQIIFESDQARTDFQKQNSEARKKIAQEEKNAIIQALDAVAQSLLNASDLLGKNTKAGKALAIASATISMLTSAQKAYEATVGIPFVGPVLAPINAGLAIAAGIKNIREIAKVKVPGGGSGGGVPNPPTPPPGTAPMQPVLSPAVQGQALNAQAINDLGNQSLRAYVMNSDIQNNNQRNAYLERNARIG